MYLGLFSDSYCSEVIQPSYTYVFPCFLSGFCCCYTYKKIDIWYQSPLVLKGSVFN